MATSRLVRIEASTPRQQQQYLLRVMANTQRLVQAIRHRPKARQPQSAIQNSATRLQQTGSTSMELLTPHQLQMIYQRIITGCTPIGDCLVWSKKFDGKPVKHEPKFEIGERGSRRIRALAFLWYKEYGEWPPRNIWHKCENAAMCFNVQHKTLSKGKPLTEKRFRRYKRHTDQCPGIDWVLIERLASAGTIEVISEDHQICDCERAYLVQHTDFPMRDLQMSGTTRIKLLTNIR